MTNFFRASEPLEVNASSTSKNTLTSNLTEKKHASKNKTYATVESPPSAKKMTSKDESPSCKNVSQATRSSQTSDQASTSTERVFDPSLNWLPKEQSLKLWLPTEIGCADLHTNWWSGSFESMKSNSWFSIKKWNPQKKMNSQKTFLQSSMFSIAESTEEENIKIKQRKNTIRKSKKPVANLSRKYGIKATLEQKKILKQWFGSVRHTYNWALSCIKKKPTEYKANNHIWLRKRFVNACNIPKTKKFLLEVPKSIRDTAITDLAEAYKSNYAIRKKNPNHTFDLKFRKKTDTQSLTITSESIKKWDHEKHEFSMFPTFLKDKIKIYAKKTVPDKVSYDCKITMDRLGDFSFVLVYHEEPCENQTGLENKWCAIDPGVRSLWTIYSPEPGIAYKVGDKDISRVYRLCKHLDVLISKKTKNARRKEKAINKARKRIKDLVTEVHCKTVHFLLKNFNKIIIPPFEVSNMVKRANRKINSKTVRQMLCWRHYGLKERLKNAACKYTNVDVYVRDEHYTSKTCTHCRSIHPNLGGAKVYRCRNCGLVTDRDCNGSRNIFIKNTALEGFEPTDFASLEPGV